MTLARSALIIIEMQRDTLDLGSYMKDFPEETKL